VGGVGKTRLALYLAADLRRSFTDGVRLAELSALRNAGLLARTVAASLGLPDEAAGDPVDVLLCWFHHQVVIHRWGWTLVPNPDGTTTAWNKDKTKVSVLPGSITAPFVVGLAA
jgi:hypothetical protein